MSLDMLQAAQDALFAALKPIEGDVKLPQGMAVYVDVPLLNSDDKLPPMVIVGLMQSDDASAKASSGTEQYEMISATVNAVYRGQQRHRLLAMLHAARAALVGKEISLPGSGVLFEYPRFVSAVADDVMPDGVTYLGVLQVQFMGWPG